MGSAENVVPSFHEQRNAAVKASRCLLKKFREQVFELVCEALQVTPTAVSQFLPRVSRLEESIPLVGDREDDILSSDRAELDYPVLKLALLEWRRVRAMELESPRALTTDREVIRSLDGELATIDWLLGCDALQLEAAAMPRLTDYMSVYHAGKLLKMDPAPPSPKHDQKFGILLSPDRVVPDFEYFRAECELRDLPISFAFVDIDDFKSYNTRFGHNIVDIDLLPQFQQAIEAHVFQRGRAYREGGDEYILLLPNMSFSQVPAFMESLQERLLSIRYRLPKINDNPTVSIGVVTVEPCSVSTTREVRQAANTAMMTAKARGKKQVVCERLLSGPPRKRLDHTH